MPHKARQTPDVVIVGHGALGGVGGVAAVVSVDVAEAFLVAVVVQGRPGALTRWCGWVGEGQYWLCYYLFLCVYLTWWCGRVGK